jgi:hypothetical protein
MIKCPYCGGHETAYSGIDDGGGDFGDEIVDMYYCLDCDLTFEGYGYQYNPEDFDEDNDAD